MRVIKKIFTTLLAFSLVACGGLKDSKKESPQPKQQKQKEQPEETPIKNSLGVAFPLTGLSESVRPYALCGLEGQAYDSENTKCRDLSANEEALQGFYRRLEGFTRKPNENTIEVFGNLYVETGKEGNILYNKFTLSKCKKDETSQIVDEIVRVECHLKIESLTTEGGYEMDLIAFWESHVGKLILSGPFYEIKYASDVNPRSLKSATDK